MSTLTKRRSQLPELTGPRSWLTPLFSEIDTALSSAASRIWSPAIDVVKQNGDLIVRADVPGIKPDEIDIEFEDDVLTLSGEHSETKEETEGRFMRRERTSGSFRRSIAMPSSVKPEDIEATCHDGVLEVKIPIRAAEEKHPVKITPTTG